MKSSFFEAFKKKYVPQQPLFPEKYKTVFSQMSARRRSFLALDTELGSGLLSTQRAGRFLILKRQKS